MTVRLVFLADLGRPGEYDHPKVREAYERTIAACRKPDASIDEPLRHGQFLHARCIEALGHRDVRRMIRSDNPARRFGF